jgi:hypothetical protein
MPTTLFNVYSDRTRDIQLNPGTTVGQLRRILKEGGYDVVEATAHVDRADGSVLHGYVDNYVLKEGDGVRFNTVVHEYPAEDYLQKQEEARKAAHACTCHECKCDAAEQSVSVDTLKSGDRTIVVGKAKITMNGDTVTIVIGK